MTAEMEKHSAMKQEFETTQQGAVPVRFARGDSEDPFNWPLKKKLRMFMAAVVVTYVSAFNASANGSSSISIDPSHSQTDLICENPGAASPGFLKEHEGVSSEDFQASSFTYLVMLGIGKRNPSHFLTFRNADSPCSSLPQDLLSLPQCQKLSVVVLSLSSA